MKDIALTHGFVLGRVDDVPDAGAIVVDFAEGEARLSVLLTRRGAHVAAFHNRCPHAGYPLERHDGRVVVQQQRFIVCTAHGASFVLDDGACAGGPCNGEALSRIAIVVRDGLISVA
ncbi:MAG: Rieske (2Fe-2S) protein [Hyphomonadaceae bacterium]